MLIIAYVVLLIMDEYEFFILFDDLEITVVDNYLKQTFSYSRSHYKNYVILHIIHNISYTQDVMYNYLV